MPNKARRYHYAESLGTSTSTVTTDTTKVTLTFTPDASSTYVYLWNCDVAGSTTSYDTRVNLNNNAGTVLCASNWETKDVTADWSTLSGMAFETFGASPTSQSITLRFSSEIATSHTASIRNARIIAIKLTSEDIYAENTTDQTTTLATQVNALSITVNPSTSGSYLVLGSCEARSAAVGTGVITQIAYAPDGLTDKAYSAATNGVSDATNYNSFLMQAAVGTISASRSIRLQFYSGTSGTTVNCRRARLLALRLDEFSTADVVGTNSDAPESTTTTSTTYVNKKTSSVYMDNGLSYLVIGSAATSGGSTTVSVGHGLSVDGTYISESFKEASTGTILAPGMFTGFTVKTPTTTSTMTVNLDYKAETTAVSAGMSYPTISVLLLDPTDLYWVGGSGTWDSSNNSNWAVSSGGTGGAAAPKSGTNVRFNENSDSSAPFTVTVGTGAICQNFIVQNLDQTMTLSGSAALSVYGSFSILSTIRFVQSYTGTITFASGLTQAIVTNGKVFSSIVVDNGSSLSLADALTISGQFILTSGNVSLDSYTLTCSKFASNGTITRSINFGTGKIVLTSALTEAVWSTSSVTGLSISGTPLVQLTGGGATTKSISTGALSEANSISFQLSTTAGTVTFTASDIVRDLIIDNNSFTLANIAITLYGNLTIAGTTPTLTAGINAMTFAGTTGTQTITTNGKTLDFPIIFSGTGTYALGSALSVGTTTSRIVTFTAGTLELNSYTLTIYGPFQSSNSNIRRIQMSGTGGKIVISLDTTTTVWTTATATNMTTDGNIIVQTTGGGATTKTINTGALSEANAISFQISNTAGTVTFSANSTFKNITIDNNSVTISTATITIYGDVLVNGTTPTLAAGAGIWTFAATSGIKTINLNGNNSNSLDFPVTFNGVGGTWQLQHNLTIGVSAIRTTTLTNGTLDLNEYNLTIYGNFSSSNSNARTIDFGNASKIILRGGAGTPFTSSTATNMTVVGTNPLIQLTGDANTGGNFTLTFGAHSESNSISVQLSSAVGPTTVTLTGSIRNFTIDDYNISLANSTRTIYGDFIVAGTTPILTAGGTTTTFAATSGIKTINLNGNASNVIDFPLTFSGAGGTWQLQHNLTIGAAALRNTTFSNGTLDLNNFNLTIYGSFLSSTSNARTIAFGTGKILLTANGATATTIWSTAAAANLSVTGTPLVEVTGSGTLVRTIDTGGASTENSSISFSLLTSAGTITLNAASVYRNLTVNCAGTTVNLGSSQTLYGSYTYTAGTIGTIGTFTFAATSGTKTISSGASTSFTDLTINGPGAIFEIANNITMTGTFTLTAGTFSALTYNISASIFNSNNSNVRTLNMGSGTWTLSGTTFWNITDGTNLTLNKETANIVASYASTGAVSFYGGDKIYNNLTYSTTSTGAGNAVIYGSNTFDTITFSNPGRNVWFESGTTNSLNNIILPANATNNSALRSTVSGSVANLVYTGSSKIRLDYLNLVRDINASPADTWYMGGNSTDSGNNTNVYFYNPPLYWIGGSGTWNNSSGTNWSFFSGGSSVGAGVYPDQYTDIFFDANSDTGTTIAIATPLTTTLNCRDISVISPDVNIEFTLGGGSNLAVYGNMILHSNFAFTGTSGSARKTIFAATTTGKTITTNGVSMREVEFNGVGGGWTLQDNMSVVSYTNLVAGAVNLNDYTLTTESMNVTGTTTRSIAFGTTGKIVLTGVSGREWDGTTLTNFTVSGSKRVEYTGTTALSFRHGDTAGGSENTSIDFFITSMLAGNSISIDGYVRSLDFTGSSGTWLMSSLTVYGNLTLSSTVSITFAATQTLTFAGTIANGNSPQNITTNGVNVNWTNVTFSGTATYTLLDEFNSGTSTNPAVITLTTGTIAMGNNNIVHYGTFTSSGSGVRGITSTGGVYKLTNNITATTTVWTTTTLSNMTNSNLVVELYGTGSGFTRTISPGTVASVSESSAISFVVAQTNGTFTISNGHAVKNLTFKDNAYLISLTTNTLTIYGDLLFEGSTNVSFTGGTGIVTFGATSGTQTITTNGETIDKPITFGGTATYQLGGAVTIGSTRNALYSSGNLNLNGYTFTVGTFEASGTASRTIYHGSNGTIAVTGSGATAFNANGSNITANGVGTINMTSATAKTFVANGNSFSVLNQGGAGALTILGDSSFYSLRNTVSNTTISAQRSQTLTFTNNFEVSGANATHQVTIDTVAPVGGDPIAGDAYATFVYSGANTINVQQLKLLNYTISASPSNVWFVRNSEKIFYSGSIYYNNETSNLAGNGANTGNGWVFVRENGFLSSFM